MYTHGTCRPALDVYSSSSSSSSSREAVVYITASSALLIIIHWQALSLKPSYSPTMHD